MNFVKKLENLRDKILDKPWKKLTVACVLTVLVIGLVTLTSIYLNPSLRQRYFGTAEVIEQVQKSAAEYRFASFSPTNALFKKKSIEDLGIYPDGWVQANFDQADVDKGLSKPDADLDQDGLVNKQEFIYGSNPKNKDTLGDGKTDGQYVKDNLSPITGLPLESKNPTFYFLQSEQSGLKSVSESYDILFDQGIDLQKLYEQSRTFDFKEELEQIKVSEIENPNRIQALGYLEQRLNILGDTVSENLTLSLANIYKILKIEDLVPLETKINQQISALSLMAVPKNDINSHRANVYFLQQIKKVINMRKEYLQGKFINEDEYNKTNQEIVKRMVWAFRVVADNTSVSNTQN
jgi:hypothetical protein